MKAVVVGMRGAAGVAAEESAGADAIIDLSMDDLRDGLRNCVREITDGHGVDLVADPVGGKANAAVLRAMALRARMVIIGFASGTIPTIKANYLPVKNISVSGLQWSDYRDRRLEWISKAQTGILDPFLKARVKPYISQQLHLANNAHALATLQEGKAQGKIILTTLL